MIRIVFLGKLADVAGEPQREVAGPLDWDGLLAALGSDLAASAQNQRTKIAVDGEVLPDKAALSALEGSEIALLPPVSGG
ncbi:MAG: MoaD/ThiS family protein [Alteraurantiacibacter sp.]